MIKGSSELRGNVSITLRPIRLGFLVDPHDQKSLLEAIHINTFLWGGADNPIIPTYKRAPRQWSGERLGKSPTANEIVAGYIDAFDPDVLVRVGNVNPTLDATTRPVITPDDIWMGNDRGDPPKYGIGLFEVLDYFVKKEMTFQRRHPLNISFVQGTPEHSIFWASVFGSFPSTMVESVKCVAKIMSADEPTARLDNFLQLLEPGKLFPRRMTHLYLDRVGWRHPRQDCIFFLDATNSLDIIDYWNLRTCGWDVVPVPKQASGLASVRQEIDRIIEENHYPLEGNPRLHNTTCVLKARSISEAEFKAFYSSLTRPVPATEPKFMGQSWYPRIWDEWARGRDNAEHVSLKSKSKDWDDISFSKGSVTLRAVTPKFIDVSSRHYRWEPRYANEVEIRVFGDEEPLAEVFPEGGQNLARALRSFGTGTWRFTKGGPVLLTSSRRDSLFLSAPLAEDVFIAWMEDLGWKVTISSPGRLAKQMQKQLGGRWGVNTLTEEGLIKLLDSLSEGRTIGARELKGKIQEIINRQDLRTTAPNYIRRLMEVDMFRLGFEVQCSVCAQRTWYALDSIRESLQCQKCLAEFPAPTHEPDEFGWSYRTFGPFSLPRRSYGVYSVLLTLNFFTKQLDGACSPIMSFIAKKDGKELEADLGLLYRKFRFDKGRAETIFAECKTYNEFMPKDVERMSSLAEQFPGAIIVFSTLRRSLTAKEKRLIARFANRGRRYWKAERPYNPVLILTGCELFADEAPPRCWEEAGGSHAEFAKKYRWTPDLPQLCDATQQLYLGLKSWHEWLNERFARRRAAKGIASAATAPPPQAEKPAPL